MAESRSLTKVLARGIRRREHRRSSAEATSVRTPPRDKPTLIRKLGARQLIVGTAQEIESPQVKSVARMALRLDILLEHIELLKDAPLRSAPAPVEPMLENKWRLRNSRAESLEPLRIENAWAVMPIVLRRVIIHRSFPCSWLTLALSCGPRGTGLAPKTKAFQFAVQMQEQ